jgi:hypothetical protein
VGPHHGDGEDNAQDAKAEVLDRTGRFGARGAIDLIGSQAVKERGNGMVAYSARFGHRQTSVAWTNLRAIQKMASSTRRWSRAGLPPSGPADTTKSSKKEHSSSVSSPRINADLHARDQRGITPAAVWESPSRRFVHAT